MDTKTLKDIIKTIIPNSLLIHRLPKAAANSVLLTFDDGPDEQITPQILDRLEQYNARAVFFVIGEKVEKFPHILEMITKHGHLIGNHTQTHPYREIPRITEYRTDITRCQEIISATIATTSGYYRPPAGTISISGLLLARSLKLKTMLWSIEGGEWGVHKKDSELVIGNRVKEYLQPRDIVLLHDNNIKTLTILDIILPDLNRRKLDLYNGVHFL